MEEGPKKANAKKSFDHVLLFDISIEKEREAE